MGEMILSETGGTTGDPCHRVFFPEEFLAERMGEKQRQQIRGIYTGGMAQDPATSKKLAEFFPAALLIVFDIFVEQYRIVESRRFVYIGFSGNGLSLHGIIFC